MEFLRKKPVIIWVVLLWAFAQFLVAGSGNGIVGEMPRIFYVFGYRVITLSILAYLFYRGNVVAKWLFMVYVGFLGVEGIVLRIMQMNAGQYNYYMLPLTFVLGAYFVYGAVCIYRYY